MHYIFDVISICETWFNEYNMNIYDLQVYNSFHTTKNHKKLVASLFILRVHFLQIK